MPQARAGSPDRMAVLYSKGTAAGRRNHAKMETAEEQDPSRSLRECDMEEENSRIIDFYSGYEGDPKITVTASEGGRAITLMIWDGYFRDIFDNAPADGGEWRGFNRDYQKKLNAFAPDHPVTEIPDLQEYLEDAEANAEQGIAYAEARQAAENLISLLKTALENDLTVTVQVEQ